MQKLVLALLLACAPFAHASDIGITPTGPVYAFAQQPFLGPLAWGTNGPGGFNNNFFFVPLALNENICLYVYNNNPTNPHTFTASIVITGNPSELTPSDGTWQAIATAPITSPISPGIAGGVGGPVSGAAKISINLSASSVQAGSPDTAAVVIVQTSGNCSSGNNFVGVSSPGSTPIQNVSDALSSAFTIHQTIVNPAANEMVLNVTDNSSNKSLFFNRVLVSCSAVCNFNVIISINTGTGCTNITTSNGNQKIGSPVTSVAFMQNGSTCTITPSSNAIVGNFFLAANSVVNIPLDGFIAPLGTTFGMEVFEVTAMAAGTIDATFYWYEK